MVQHVANQQSSNLVRMSGTPCLQKGGRMIAEATTPLAIAEKYINAWSRRDIDSIGELVHPQIHLKSPVTEVDGKAAFLDAVKRTLEPLEQVTVRAKFGSDTQAILVYDFQMKGAGLVRNANLMTFQDNLIQSVELFFDASPFQKKS